jgi:Right handed beta helix region
MSRERWLMGDRVAATAPARERTNKMTLKRRSAILLGTALATMAASAPSAFASTEWVSGAAPSAPFNSCEHPGFNSIQSALSEGTGSKIEVCDGTYAEQLNIERAVKINGNGAKIQLPATPHKSETACDAASEAGDHVEDQDLISVCTSGKVSINGITADAIWPGNPIEASVSCGFNLYGILVAGGADLTLTESVVIGAAPASINGCQYGVGVQIGMSYASPAQAGEATLKDDTLSGYQKNGVTVDGEGSQAKITDIGVSGAGPTAEIAQNGIGVQLGAKATINAVKVKRNECNNATCGSDPLADYQAEGVYFFGAARGSSIKNSLLTENDAGVEAFDTGASEPTKPLVTISNNTITKNRYEGVLLNQGSTKVNGGVITDSNVGIEALQVGEGEFAQSFGPEGTVTGVTISGMSEWAVEGDSDNAAGDKPGSIKVSNSAISGNPGATAAESVTTNNPTGLPIILKEDS